MITIEKAKCPYRAFKVLYDGINRELTEVIMPRYVDLLPASYTVEYH